ncbi:unnamed protein product [Calicophoron daubneyi]|uniref:Proactivator polypeptide n=1 Tax=Calicophoron daubneyi TaxID=300641 RepID=A0AAV2SZ24_CALDB
MYLIASLFLILAAAENQNDYPEYCYFRKLARILKLGISQKEVEDLVKMNCKVINFRAEMAEPEYCANPNIHEMTNLNFPEDTVQNLFKSRCNLTDRKSSARTRCESCQDSYKELVKMAKSGSSNTAIKSLIYSTCAEGAHSERCRRILMNVSWNIDEGTDDLDSPKICREAGLCEEETKNPEHCKFTRLSQMIKSGISITDIEALLSQTCQEIIFKEDTIRPGYCTSRSLDKMELFGVSRNSIKEVYRATCAPKNVELENRTLCAVCKDAHQKLLSMVNSSQEEQDRFVDKVCMKLSGRKTAQCRSGLQYIGTLLRMKHLPIEANKLCSIYSECHSDERSHSEFSYVYDYSSSATTNNCDTCRTNAEKLKEMVQAGLPSSSIEQFIQSVCIIAHWKEPKKIDPCRLLMQEVYKYLSFQELDGTQSLCQKANLCSEGQDEHE